LRVGIDLMGSDRSPNDLFLAVLKAACRLDATHQLEVLATQEVIDQLVPLVQQGHLSDQTASITFYQVSTLISMDDDPRSACLHKKDSSLFMGVERLKNKKIDAFVSCGNTGALITAACLLIPRLSGIKRPALLLSLPTERGEISVLDVGGNLHVTSQSYVEWALLGAAFHKATKAVLKPKVGLLNIGTESKKGTKTLRAAYQSLMAMSNSAFVPIEFIGNIEAYDVFKGNVDVLVTDGFTGNVFLKAAEGVASFIFNSIALPSEFKKRFSYEEYPGALICGIDAIILKAHGKGSIQSLFNTILQAVSYVRLNLPSNLG